MSLAVRRASVVYPIKVGEGIRALSESERSLNDGDFVVALGASGCGKITLLNLIAGFIQPSDGAAILDDQPILGPGVDPMALTFEKIFWICPTFP